MVSIDRKLAHASASLVIVQRLNMTDPPAPVRRVIGLLELLHELQIRTDTAERLKRHDPGLETLRREINRILLPYDWTPVFPSNSMTAITVWSKSQARKVAETDSSPFGEVHSSDRITAEEFESQAVWYLLQKGQWERYRRCQQCRDWFYALTDFQRFCKQACRQKAAAKSDVFKEKRRAYMRKRYEKESAERKKEKELRAKRSRRKR